jgi:hypothetical protein
MLSLMAVAPEDGWAFVQQGDKVFLARPPYQRAQLQEVSPETVARAIAGHGFQASARRFDDWGAVVEYLRGELVRATAHLPKELEPARRRLLRHAPRQILEGYLDRIASELLPGREWGPASELLEALAGLDQLAKDSSLQERVAQLLQQCAAAVKEHERSRSELAEPDMNQRFPLTARRYGPNVQRFMREVRQGGGLMRMAS